MPTNAIPSMMQSIERMGSGNIYNDPITYTPTDKALGNHYKSSG